MNNPKRHHVVPEFYLERFADAGVIRVTDLTDPTRTFVTKPHNALIEQHFYSYIDEEGDRSPAFENALATHFEYPAQQALIRTVDGAGFPPSAPDRTAIIGFIAMQLVRGPGFRRLAQDIYNATGMRILEHLTPEMLRANLHRIGEADEAHVGELYEYARSALRVEPDKPVNHHLGLALQAFGPLFDELSLRDWQLVDFEHPVLITGDEPVCLIGRRALLEESVGVRNALHVAIPVGPTRALFLTQPGDQNAEERRAGTAFAAQTLNKYVAFQSYRWAVEHPKSRGLAGISIPPKAGYIWRPSDDLIAANIRPVVANARSRERNRRKAKRRGLGK